MDLNGCVSSFGKWSLQEIHRRYRKELMEDTIDFWTRCGIDHRHGGYLRPDKPTGICRNTDKDIYSQGRLLWLFSYLYNNFGRQREHLKAARQGMQVLVRNGRVPGGHWGTLYTRDWRQKQGFFDIYADIYMVLGLQEYFRATGDPQARNLAVETAYAATQTVLSPDYLGAGHGPAYEPGIKRLGTWVHLLFPLTQLLSHTSDEGLERIARFCVRNILTRHWQRDQGFAWECLDHQYQPYPEDYLSRWVEDYDWAHQILGWHAIQGAYKVMLEAVRLGSRQMFSDGLELGFQTLRAHWNEAGDGGPQEFDQLQDLKRRTGKPEPDAAMYDYLLFTLVAIEHTLSPEAMAWFDRIYSAAQKRPAGIYTGSLTLHEPRGVMLGVQILERIMQRKGKASGFFRSSVRNTTG
jgi:mannose/cellobiose epimerase-like protein (N-acyl-D-glucosamine 2-epimerase family)